MCDLFQVVIQRENRNSPITFELNHMQNGLFNAEWDLQPMNSVITLLLFVLYRIYFFDFMSRRSGQNLIKSQT